MTQVFHNDNGKDFNILAVGNFSEKDMKEYEGSWQKHYAMLLQSQSNGEYVVATYVGENSWGYGYYADGFKDAFDKFTEKAKSYLS